MSNQAVAVPADPSALTPAEQQAVARMKSGSGPWFTGPSARFIGLGLFFGLWQVISAFVLPSIDPNLVSLMPPLTEVVVAAWEGDIDRDTAHAVLDGRQQPVLD